MDERAAKNEIKFMENVNEIKDLIQNEQAIIEKLDINDFADVCYLTQYNYKDLLQNMDCLGICVDITRNSEVVIIDPNFLKVNEIGYSSFVSLNSMYMALKYYIDRSVDEQEIIKLHGGFMKNFKSHFLDGTHRARYNAMIPLYVNKFHWNIARRLLKPLFGYLVTLNIEGFAANQYYVLYFLMFEKVITDLLENPNSEAIKRIYNQIKLCCQDIIQEFYILKPNVLEFITERTKRTKDIWPNLNSYLLYIYLTEDELNIAKKHLDEFEYAYFEEQLRRYLGSEFQKTRSVELFTIDKSNICAAAEKLSIMYMENEEKYNFGTSSSENLINIINENSKFQLKSFEEALNEDFAIKLKTYFNKFQNNRSTSLFNYVFNTETNFFVKFENISIPLIYQMLINGFDNVDWRNYKNYHDFMKYDSKKYLNEIYLDQISKVFSIEYNKHVSHMIEKRAEILSNKYLTDEQYSSYEFIIGEGIYFGKMMKSLQKFGDKERIFHFLENSFNSKTKLVNWKPSDKNIYKFFKNIYINERKQVLDLPESRSDLNVLKKSFPVSWTILSRYAPNKSSYLFSWYRFNIDREEFQDYSKKWYEYFSENDLKIFFSKLSFSQESDDSTQDIINIYVDYSQKPSNKPIVELSSVWIKQQLNLKKQIILHDQEDWQSDLNKLKFIAVADLITDKKDNSTCAACLLIFEIDHIQQKLILKEGHLLKTKLVEPYVSGLLAFREAYAYEYLLKKCTVKPQCLIFDGNGILHKREFGLASHVGVLQDIVTIGFSKTLYFVDTFPYKTYPEFKSYYKNLLKKFQDYCELRTLDNKILGYAYLSGANSLDPVFVSQGHKISLQTAMNVIKMIDTFLKNMNKSARESLVSIADKISRRYLNHAAGFSTNLNDYF